MTRGAKSGNETTDKVIADRNTLETLCRRWAEGGILYFDTEFVRDTTYWPKLCLIQAAGIDGEAYAIDPLAEGMDLAPFQSLLLREDVLKVLHAGRQDIEIFYHQTGRAPEPLFDTQIAAMVCGFGESVGYDTLVRNIAGGKIDKSSRFSDWARRPLSQRQLEYALADVTYLPAIHKNLEDRLIESGRVDWVSEEISTLTSEETYKIEPRDIWKRLKTRSTQPRFLAIVRELAAARETMAQERNVPRQRIVRDEALLEIAAQRPRNEKELSRLRGMHSDVARGAIGRTVLQAVETGLSVPDKDCPVKHQKESIPKEFGPMLDLLKMLLRLRSEQHGIATKLLANTEQLEQLILAPEKDHIVLHGWRREYFGNDALSLLNGELAFTIRDGRIHMFPVEP